MFQLLVCGTRYGTQGLLFHDPTSSILACRTIRAPLRSRSCPCNWRCRLAQILMLLEQIWYIKEIQSFALVLQSLIQKWSFEFALFQMFCTVPVNENLHRRRNWSDCEMHFEVLLEATRHDADLGSLQNSSENLSLQSKAEWSCHQFCRTGLSYLISTGSVVADESYYIFIYYIWGDLVKAFS